MTIKIASFVILAMLAFSCSAPLIIGGKVHMGSIADGVYEGEYYSWPNKAWTRVTIKDSKIASCVVYKTRGVFRKTGVEEAIPKRIIEHQSTHVDAISGATNFSRVVMNSAQEALSKAVK